MKDIGHPAVGHEGAPPLQDPTTSEVLLCTAHHILTFIIHLHIDGIPLTPPTVRDDNVTVYRIMCYFLLMDLRAPPECVVSSHWVLVSPVASLAFMLVTPLTGHLIASTVCRGDRQNHLFSERSIHGAQGGSSVSLWDCVSHKRTSVIFSHVAEIYSVALLPSGGISCADSKAGKLQFTILEVSFMKLASLTTVTISCPV